MHRRQVREGHRCSCAAAERRTSLFEAELSAKVTDGTERHLDATSQADLSPAACKCSPRRHLSLLPTGTGEAYLSAAGQPLWALLQSSRTQIRQVEELTHQCGPLSCTLPDSAYGAQSCLSYGRGLWRAGRGQLWGYVAPLTEADRRVLHLIWPSPVGSWRGVVAHCKVRKTPSRTEARATVWRLGGEEGPALARDGYVSLEACEITPLFQSCPTANLAAEVQRKLEALAKFGL